MTEIDFIADLFQLALGAAQKDIEDLTEPEQFALAVAAGCQVEWVAEGDGNESGRGQGHMRTKNRVGFRRVNGKIEVIQGAP